MPFNTKTVMEQKQEFVTLHKLKGISFSELCMRFKISRRTGYKWVKRYGLLGVEGLKEQSRRPNQSPLQSCLEVEDHIVALRNENPEWGAKKIFALLEGQKSKGAFDYIVPAKSTISSILKRRGLISKANSERAQKWQRFEYEEPNALWQMDFKGHFELINKRTCHPLTVMDDHSRFNLCLAACENQQAQTVKDQLINIFRTYGLPDAILADNGAPWGTTGHVTSHNERCFTKLEKWLIQQHIRIIHGKPYHPQTQGKEERFHRTLKIELLQHEDFKNYVHCQERFDWWRNKYNCYRPHEAIDMDVPINRYRPSNRCYTEQIKMPEYNSNQIVKKVKDGGFIHFKGRHHVGKAFIGDFMVLMPTTIEKEYELYYYNQFIRKILL